MKIRLLAVGTRMPAWVETGVGEYQKRLPPELEFSVQEIAPGRRGKSSHVARAIADEGEAILAAIAPRDHVIALEVKGRPVSTEKLAKALADWRMQGLSVSILVGGADGLSDACRARADQQWSLSALTLPHALVRVLVAEQIYRAWTVLNNHPYHR